VFEWSVMVVVDQSAPARPVPGYPAMAMVAVVVGVLGVAIGLIVAKVPPSRVDGPAIVNLRLDTTYDGTSLSVGLSRPVAYPVRGRRAVTFNIAVANRTTATPFSLASLDIQAVSGNAQDAQLTDPANNVGASSATVLPGRSLVWQIAFTVPAAAHDITVQVSPVDGVRTVVFSGSL
jgi:hypothetical protein